MCYEIELPWYNPKLNPNKRPHWAVKAKLKKKQRADAYYIAKAAGNPPVYDMYNLKITFHPPGDYGYDIDNSIASIKGAIDGIADAWGVNDKNFRYDGSDFGEVVENGKIIIEISRK